MFLGQYSHNLDDKNRIIIPTKFREALGNNAVITLGYDRCLCIYTEEGWNNLQTKLLEMKDNLSDHRKHIRLIVGSASECSCDKQGRVNIPLNLIQIANIKKEVVLVGNMDHVEIWSKESWDTYYQEAYDSFDELAEKLDQ